MINNNIITIHPILGEITISDLINYLQIMLKDIITFEDIINQILHNTELSNEDISTLFNYSIINRLEWIIYLLEQLL